MGVGRDGAVEILKAREPSGRVIGISGGLGEPVDGDSLEAV